MSHYTAIALVTGALALSGLGREGSGLKTTIHLLSIAGAWYGVRKLFGHRDAAAVLREDARPFHLIVRSFEADSFPLESRIGSIAGLRINRTLEDVIAIHFAKAGPVVAVGRPDEPIQPRGAARLYLEGADWRTRVIELMDAAERIVVIVGRSKGVNWEIEQIDDRRHWNKTTLVVPPGDSAAWRLFLWRWRSSIPWPIEQDENLSVVHMTPSGIRTRPAQSTVDGYEDALSRATEPPRQLPNLTHAALGVLLGVVTMGVQLFAFQNVVSIWQFAAGLLLAGLGSALFGNGVGDLLARRRFERSSVDTSRAPPEFEGRTDAETAGILALFILVIGLWGATARFNIALDGSSQSVAPGASDPTTLPGLVGRSTEPVNSARRAEAEAQRQGRPLETTSSEPQKPVAPGR